MKERQKMGYKKLLIISTLLITIMFPEVIFGGLAILGIGLLLLIFIVEIALDVYIVIVFLKQHFSKE